MSQWAKKITDVRGISSVMNEAFEVVHRTLPKGPVEMILRRPKRSLDQNSLMWPLLKDFSEQAELFGQKIDSEGWKIVLSDAFEGETQYLPKLDGKGMISRAPKTSEYPKDTFSGLIEFIFAEGVTRGVTFSDKSEQSIREINK